MKRAYIALMKARRVRRWIVNPGSLLLATLAVTPALAHTDEPCTPSWKPTYGGIPGVDGIAVMAIESFVENDGSDPATFVGGAIFNASGIEVNGIVRYKDGQWSPVGSGENSQPWAMHATCLPIYGDVLCVGGAFTTMGGIAANGVALWDGAAWTALGEGVNGTVRSIASFDDGAGVDLYVGGEFTTAGGKDAPYIAKWDGQQWSELPPGPTGQVRAMKVFDDGSGPALYVGAKFLDGNGDEHGIARWDGKAWSMVGDGLDASVISIEVFDDGAGPALYVGGNEINRWDGVTWSAANEGLTNGLVRDLKAVDVGDGLELYAAGKFFTVDSESTAIIKWNGTGWSTIDGAMHAEGRAIGTLHDGDGTQNRLIVGGTFWFLSDGMPAILVAAWDGESWASIGAGLNSDVTAIVSGAMSDEEDVRLYAGGKFSVPMTPLNLHIAQWDGAQWLPLGAGLSGGHPKSMIFDQNGDLGDPALYVGGTFETAGNVECHHIAKWDGTQWHPLGAGTNDTVWAMAIFDDGSGPQLYAAGEFTLAGESAAGHIARWDGTQWHPVGDGANQSIFALQPMSTVSGDVLIAAGAFTQAGETTAHRIAAWDGESWNALGGGLNNVVITLAASGAGDSQVLYAGGYFTLADGVPANRIARWDGSVWSPLGEGFNDHVTSIAVVDRGPRRQPTIFAAVDGSTRSTISRRNGTGCHGREHRKISGMGPGACMS